MILETQTFSISTSILLSNHLFTNIPISGLPEEEIKQYFIQSLGVSFENAPSNDKLCIVCFDILRDKPYCILWFQCTWLLLGLSEDMEMTYQSKKIHLDESDQQPISDRICSLPVSFLAFTKWIIYQIEHCDHQVDTFSVDVTVSPSLLIRNYTIFSISFLYSLLLSVFPSFFFVLFSDCLSYQWCHLQLCPILKRRIQASTDWLFQSLLSILHV